MPKHKDHYVPQLHLEYFQVPERKGYIWRYWKATSKPDKTPQPIKDVAAENNFETVVLPSGEESRDLAQKIAQIESRAAEPYRKISQKQKVSRNEKHYFNAFIALQFLRTPSTKRNWAESYALSELSHFFESLNDDEKFAEGFEELKLKFGLKDEQRQEFLDYCNNRSYYAKISKQQTSSVFKMLPYYVEQIDKMHWHLIEAPAGHSFITSDHPVSISSSNKKSMMKFDLQTGQPLSHKEGIEQDDLEITFPLTPNLVWMGAWKKYESPMLVAKPRRCKELNRFQAQFASDYVFSDGHYPWIERLMKNHPQSTEVRHKQYFNLPETEISVQLIRNRKNHT